jgi:phosphatidylglycerol:prolipoprotein diacylglycerol transferase
MIPWFNSPQLPLHFIDPRLAIHAFGVLVAIGILVGARLTQARGRQLGLHPETVSSMITTVLIVGFIMAHLFDVFAYQTYGTRPTIGQIINVFGGISSYGGFIGALIGLFFWCKKNHEPVMPYADSLAYGLAAGWAFGRLGCFTAHDHPGRLTHFFLSVNYINMGGPRHDLGLDEALWAIGVTAIFLILARRNRPIGLYVGLLSFLYGPVRFALDFLRVTGIEGADPRYFGLTPAQYGSIAVTLAGAGLLAWTWRNHARQAAAEVKAT